MEVILSKQCESLTGLLNHGHGYFIQRRGKRFFGQRSKHTVPPDGHWKFIVACAHLAKGRLYVTDVRVKREELQSALREAHHFVAADHLALSTYRAADILNLKTTFGL